MGWRVLLIEESTSLSLYLDNIKVKKIDNEYLFPISDIAIIVVDNYKTLLSVNLLNSCSKRNVPILFCGDNHHPLNILLPLEGHFESTKILLEQIKWEYNLKASIWKIIVKRKIKNQLYVLRKCTNDHDSCLLLEKYIEEVQDFDVTNREGLAAKVYFRALFGTNFSRNSEDCLNACLNYGYSIIRALISRTLVSKGLNTQLGIFHKGPENYFNLSDDFIEIFRPIIDLFVFEHFKDEKIFTRNIRLQLLSIINAKLFLAGQKITINHAIESFVDSVISVFKDGNTKKFVEFDPEIYDL